ELRPRLYVDAIGADDIAAIEIRKCVHAGGRYNSIAAVPRLVERLHALGGVGFDEVHGFEREVGLKVRARALGVAGEPALFVGDSKGQGVGWKKAGHYGVLISNVIGDDVVLLQIEKHRMAPEWRVVFLIVIEDAAARGNRVRLAAEVGDVGNAL